MKKILSIGAHATLLGYLYAIFRQNGQIDDEYLVEVDSVQSAIARKKPDLILYHTTRKKEEEASGLKRITEATHGKIPIIVTGSSPDHQYQQKLFDGGALFYVELPCSTEVLQKYINDALQIQQAIVRTVRTIEFRPEHQQAGIAILAYFSRVLERKYPHDHYTVSITQDASIVTLEVRSIDGTIDKIETALKDYGLVVKGEKGPEYLFEDKLDVMSLSNKLDIAAMELRHMEKLYRLSESRADERIAQLEENVRYMRQLVGQSMSSMQESQSGFLALIREFSESSNAQTKAALALLASRYEKGFRPEDEADVKGALVAVENDRPGFLKMVNDIFIKGSMSSVSGNYLYSWLVALSSAWPR